MFKSASARWIAGGAGLCVALLVLAYVALIGPKRSEAADLEDQTTAAEQQNQDIQTRTAQLQAQYATLPQKKAQLGSMLEQLPVTSDVPGFVRSLDHLAGTSGVVLTGVTPMTPAYLDSGSGSAVGTAGSATGSAAGAGTSGGGGQPVSIPVTVSVQGPYFKAVTFLKGLQSSQRAFLVTGLQVSVSGGDVTMTVKGSIFALPGAAAVLKDPALMSAAAAPAGTTTGPGGPAAAAGTAAGGLAGTTGPAAPAQTTSGASTPGTTTPATPLPSAPATVGAVVAPRR